MSLKPEVAAQLHDEAARLEGLLESWSQRRSVVLELPRQAVEECVGILRDCAEELVSPRQRVRG